jgi:GT2 family glycosyltransferase
MPSHEGCVAAEPHRARTTIVVLTYNSSADLADCFGSLRRELGGRADVEVVAVDNASTDDTVPRLRAEYPWVTLLQSDRNRGFAGGNNLGIRQAVSRGCEFVYLLNPDTAIGPRFLDEAIEAANAFPDAGAVQSLLLLHAEPELVNTAGNELHFLGFGFCGSFRKPSRDVPDQVREIAFASGAASLYRATALEAAGLFDDDLFLYQEDMDLGWRLRLAGWRSLVAPRSKVFHKYRFSRGGGKYYFLERNRLLVLLKNLRWRNLLVLAPFLVAAELGILAIATSQGWARAKLRATAHLFRPEAWEHVRRGRREQARLRLVSDAAIVRMFTPILEFEGVTTPLIRRVVNPLMSGLWGVLRFLIR